MTRPIVVAIAVLLLAAAAPAAEHQTYRQILTTRPALRIDDLAERSAPDRQGEVAMESFWDLLKLRDAPNPAAVPALVKVVDAHAGSSRIHRFAAGQALLTAGTPDALKALQRDTSRTDYPADLAVMYTSHWEMPEPARSRLLEGYVLRNAGDAALGASVATAWKERDGARLLSVTVTLKNKSAKPLAVLLDPYTATRGLHFRSADSKSADGTFAVVAPMMHCQPMRPRWVRLAPGASEQMEVALTPKQDSETLRQFGAAPPAVALCEGGAASFGLGGFGKHRVYAMITQPPMTDAQIATLRNWAKDVGDPAELWVGRAVSEPVEVEIGAADAGPR
jgi:hypothetical protein